MVTAQRAAGNLSPQTKVVVVVHLYGYIAEMPQIMDLAHKRDLMVLEDVPQALGAEVAGQKAGTFGELEIFPFYSHKNVTTLDKSGILVAKDPPKAALVPLLRHNGHCAVTGERQHYCKPAMGDVDLPRPGMWSSSYCLDEAESALSVALLTRIDRMNAEKRARACRFIDALSDYHELCFHSVETTVTPITCWPPT
ncbi:hypothetical protein DFAR_2810012 [Desulfarculales bacterium]